MTEACAAVGRSPRSAYSLRARPDASIFRQAWDVALDFAIRRLSDAAFSRALHGVATPIFYKGEQVGERVRYDEHLNRFLLRYRDPVRYGAWLDGYEARRHPDGAGVTLAHALNAVVDAAHDAEPFDHEDPEIPLAEGPSHPVPPHARLYDGPPELAEFFATIAEACEGDRRAERERDGRIAESRSTLIVRRPRRDDPRGDVA